MLRWLFGPSDAEGVLLSRLHETSTELLRVNRQRIELERAYFDLRREVDMQLGPKAGHILTPHDKKMRALGTEERT